MRNIIFNITSTYINLYLKLAILLVGSIRKYVDDSTKEKIDKNLNDLLIAYFLKHRDLIR
jgi:hypothetical protein